jgi:hypothetical protein
MYAPDQKCGIHLSNYVCVQTATILSISLLIPEAAIGGLRHGDPPCQNPHTDVAEAASSFPAIALRPAVFLLIADGGCI